MAESSKQSAEISQHSSASEETPLIVPDGSSSPADSASSTMSSERLWEEMDQPWPSTFERSISLLASPGVKTDEVALFTKSPKPGSTPIALQRRKNFDRGYYTPDVSFFPPRRGENLSERDGDFRKGVQKVQSLDLGVPPTHLKRFQKEQQRKAKEAQEYRKQILKKKDEEQGVMSPGYGREMASVRAKQKQQEKIKEIDLEGKATFSQCVFNLANILMGVGLLGLPFVFKSAGWFGGLFCVLVFGYITWRTSILIGRELNGDPRPSQFFDDSPYKSPLPPGSTPEARMYPPISSFPDIARAAFGETGCLILSIVLYFELFACISVFFVTIGDHLHQLYPMLSASTYATLTAALSMIPTIILKTPTLLSYLSMVGTFATVSVVVAVIFAALAEGDISERVAAKQGIQDGGPYHIQWNTSGLPLALGLVAYCFSGHAIVPSIYTSMKKPQDFEKMVTATFLAVVACCLAVACSGYYMFGSTVLDQVTLSLEGSSSAKMAMKALTWLMIITAFSKETLTMFPLALGMEETIAPYLTSERTVDLASALIKLVLTVLALVVAIFVPSFSFLCALIGMVCTMAVSVIFPAAAHMKMFWSRLSFLDKLTDSFFVALGLVMAVVGTIATIT